MNMRISVASDVIAKGQNVTVTHRAIFGLCLFGPIAGQIIQRQEKLN